jgi:hypothetical protein
MAMMAITTPATAPPLMPLLELLELLLELTATAAFVGAPVGSRVGLTLGAKDDRRLVGLLVDPLTVGDGVTGFAVRVCVGAVECLGDGDVVFHCW